MYPNMLRYRLTHYPGKQSGRLTLGLPSEIKDIPQLLKGSPDYGLSQDCGVTVLEWDFSDSAKPSLVSLAAELAGDALDHALTLFRLSDMELLAAVMARGVVHDYYGNTYWGREPLTVHLLLCGIDWSRYHGIDTEYWTHFEGTFAESDSSSEVLATDLACRCCENVHVKIGLETPSLARLIKALGAGDLSRIFEV